MIEKTERQAVEAQVAQGRAIGIAAEAIGEVMRFWNFKPSMGRIWTVLYLSSEALDAEQIEGITGLSAGNVSMSLQELQQWGVVRRVPDASRRRLYTAETDIARLIAHVFEQRELRLVDQTIAHLEEALRLVEEEGKSSQPVSMLQGRFLATRLSALLTLARAGRVIVARLARTGSVDLGPIRDALVRRVAGA